MTKKQKFDIIRTESGSIKPPIEEPEMEFDKIWKGSTEREREQTIAKAAKMLTLANNK